MRSKYGRKVQRVALNCTKGVAYLAGKESSACERSSSFGRVQGKGAWLRGIPKDRVQLRTKAYMAFRRVPKRVRRFQGLTRVDGSVEGY